MPDHRAVKQEKYSIKNQVGEDYAEGSGNGGWIALNRICTEQESRGVVSQVTDDEFHYRMLQKTEVNGGSWWRHQWLKPALGWQPHLTLPYLTHPRVHYSYSWRLSSTELFMVPHLSTHRISCSTLPIFRPDAVVASAHRLPVFSTSARRDVLLSAIGRLLLPALDFGTVYVLTSGLSRHSQHFVGS